MVLRPKLQKENRIFIIADNFRKFLNDPQFMDIFPMVLKTSSMKKIGN